MNTLANCLGRTLVIALLALRAAAAPAANPAPEISLSLRGVADRTIEVGEPLMVAVRIEVPDESPATIELAPASGTWADAVAVEISGTGNGAPVVRATLAAPPENRNAVLKAEEAAGGIWLLASSATGRLAPGDYVVRARLAIRDGRGWRGDAVSEPMPLRVVASSAAPERVLQRTLARATELALADSPAEAARVIDTVLSGDPDNIRLLTARAALCMRGGDFRAARVCVNRALSRVEREETRHPPIGLFELENQVTAALMTSGAAQATPPDWTRLPASVLAPLPEQRAPKQPTATPTLLRTSPVAPPSANAGAAPSAPAPGTGAAGARTSDSGAPTPAPAPTPSSASTPSNASPAALFGPTKMGEPSPGKVVPAAELADAKITADTAGQWAASARA
jgi:hypothetical protein